MLLNSVLYQERLGLYVLSFQCCSGVDQAVDLVLERAFRKCANYSMFEKGACSWARSCQLQGCAVCVLLGAQSGAHRQLWAGIPCLGPMQVGLHKCKLGCSQNGCAAGSQELRQG